ncbi:Peroxidase 5 [Abeliophyllum distichum]|uniref:Peroxidase n=1 Tax=Abeliophyllum distichum TaxID=126358 RepID=A0ABD1QZ05_9LAMI
MVPILFTDFNLELPTRSYGRLKISRRQDMSLPARADRILARAAHQKQKRRFCPLERTEQPLERMVPRPNTYLALVAMTNQYVEIEAFFDLVDKMTAFPNNNSARGYEVIEAAKREVEKICPGVVSCADIITLAARDASAAVGGPSWNVKLGRRDSTTASRSLANTDLPGPASDLSTLISFLRKQGTYCKRHGCLTEYTAMEPTLMLVSLALVDANALLTVETVIWHHWILVTPNSFDNNYYKNLMQRKGLLQSDQILFSGDSTDSIVSEYSRNQQTFLSDFGNAMIKMGEIEPLTGQNGIIRRICSAIN